MMQDSFEFTKQIENLLFYGWTSSSSAGLAGACFAVMVFAMLLEGTRMMSLQLETRFAPPADATAEGVPATVSSPEVSPARSPSEIRKWRLAVHALQTLVYVLRYVVGYFIMLAVMSFNAWFLIATVLGSGLGYFLFGMMWSGLNNPTPVRERQSPSKFSVQTTSTFTGLEDITEQILID